MLLKYVDTEVDLRLSSLPTVNGEKLAIRFLQRQDNLLSLEQLQFSDSNLQRYRQLFHQPGLRAAAKRRRFMLRFRSLMLLPVIL